MIELLEPLSRVPGVRLAALVTEDGVPVAVPGCAGNLDLPGGPSGTNGEQIDGLAAGAIGWLSELTSACGGLSWRAPERVVLRAARGTLLMQRTAGAILLTILDPGLDPEELRLPMDGVAARIQRVLRGMGGAARAASEEQHERVDELPGPLPSSMPSSTGGTSRIAMKEGGGSLDPTGS
jgi:predicted regulator of Ras-like GTPase activity (Roadblock/LC7/MglB family)